MKPIKLLLPALLINLLAITTKAQTSVEDAMTKIRPDCKDVYANALDLIPELYKVKFYDSLQKALTIWKKYCGDIQEVTTLEILLSIEQSAFTESKYDSTLIARLNEHATAYQNINMFGRYYVNSKKYYEVTASWANILLQRSNLSSTEKFICNVLAGNIKNPSKEIKQHSNEYTYLNSLLQEELIQEKKNGFLEYTIIAGIWSPTGNMSVVGLHPSVGLQLGGRFNRGQLDITMQVRFLKSANTYTVKRNGSLYDLDHYLGGYIGLDYTYYLVNKTKFDVGVLGGIGYDGFDIASSNEDHSNDYLKPLSISSFNFNTGMRINYIVSSSFYIGLQGRYNFINYANNGGTNLNGNAFSVDLILGFTSRPGSRYKRYY